MPLKNYGVLVGRVVDSRAEGGADTPHYQVHVRAADIDYRIAVNVKSSDSPSELLYLVDEHFRHPLHRADCRPGRRASRIVPSEPAGVALDFIRGNLFDRARHAAAARRPCRGRTTTWATSWPTTSSGPAADAGPVVYAFGERWGPEDGKPDKIFGFQPGNGVHDIHMNQGNDRPVRSDDGVWQDGGLLLHFPRQRPVGRDLPRVPDPGVAHRRRDRPHHRRGRAGPGRRRESERTRHRVRIVAALVNPVGPAPEAETVTLLNRDAGRRSISPAGTWSIDSSARWPGPRP